jgi:hypothetical protein
VYVVPFSTAIDMCHFVSCGVILTYTKIQESAAVPAATYRVGKCHEPCDFWKRFLWIWVDDWHGMTANNIFDFTD